MAPLPLIAAWATASRLGESYLFPGPDDVAAALYCLGVTNSNNLFQKVQQGKMSPFGIGKNGRRNAKGQRKA